MVRSSAEAAALVEDDAWLFSAGVRSDYQPCRDDEPMFRFLDRVRQPSFERIRAFYEVAFRRYPQGNDRKDLRARFRSPSYVQHIAARWELYQHNLWTRLGWALTPHPACPDGRFRDFLVARDGEAFYLECAVDTRGDGARAQDQRWAAVTAQLRPLATATHGLLVERHEIGPRPFGMRRLTDRLRRELAALAPGEHRTLLRVREDGWNFDVEASPLHAGGLAVAYGSVMSVQTRLYDPIRHHVKNKGRRASDLDRPLVLALLVDLGLPILEKDGAVREALFGMPITVVGRSGGHRVEAANDGVWADAVGKPRHRGVSALLVRENVRFEIALPELHHHPAAHRPLSVTGLPFRTVRYAAEDTLIAEPTASPCTVFGLPEDWPGPEEWFEGVNTDDVPQPAMWHPAAV